MHKLNRVETKFKEHLKNFNILLLHLLFPRFFNLKKKLMTYVSFNIRYLATELCECSVADIIDPKRRDDAKSIGKTEFLESILLNLPLKEIIRQSMEAVRFLHSINRIHRNLHPDNFLIFCVDNQTDHFLVKLTDFQHSKDLEASPNDSGTLGKLGWVAPEILINNDKIEKLQEDRKNVPESQFEELKSTKMTDAFIMGCYCYYVLTGGCHPFGKGVTDQRSRILQKKDNEIYKPLWDGGLEWHSSAQMLYGVLLLLYYSFSVLKYTKLLTLLIVGRSKVGTTHDQRPHSIRTYTKKRIGRSLGMQILSARVLRNL